MSNLPSPEDPYTVGALLEDTIPGARRGAAFGLAALLGFIAVVLWLVTVASALGGNPWAVAPGFLAASASYGTWKVFRSKSARHVVSRSELEMARMRDAVAALPPGTRVRRSTAGKTARATTAAWAAYAVGIVLAGVAMTGGQPDGVPWAWVIVGFAGALGGALFGLSRDGRGSRARLSTALSLPGGIGVLMLSTGWESAQQTGDLGDLLLQTGGVILVTGLPVLAGFYLARFVTWFGRTTRGVALNPPAAVAALSGELDSATDHGRAGAAVREYEATYEGMKMFTEDREQLEGAGYRLQTTTEYVKQSDEWNIPMFSALFVRDDANPSRDA